MKEYTELGRQFNIDFEINCETFSSSSRKRSISKEILSVILYASDLSGYTKKFDLSCQWSHLINQEFKNQYEEEKMLKIRPTNHFKILCDKSLFNANEANILSLVVLPLYKSIYKFERNFCRGTAKLRRDRKTNEICSSEEGNIYSQLLNIITLYRN